MTDDIDVHNESQVLRVHAGSYVLTRNKGWGDRAYVLLLLAITLIIFWKIVLTGEYTILWSGDNAREAYPWMQYLAASLHLHHLPYWNPYSEAGRLFIGEPTTGVFYPFNLLFALIPLRAGGLQPAWALEYLVVVHFFIAAVLMYFLARNLRLQRFSSAVAAITFAFCGSLAFRATGQISIFLASVWIPGVFLCYSKALRSAALWRQVLFANLGGLALGLCLLAGHHQPFLYCSTAIAIAAMAMTFSKTISLYELREGTPPRFRIARVTVLLFLFALTYSSLQVLPTLEYSHNAYRWIGGSSPITADSNVPYTNAGTSYILRPQDLASAVFPYLHPPENSIYLGILPILMVAFSLPLLRSSRLVRILWALAAVFFFTALGDLFPVHGILYELLPGWQKGREAVRSLLMTHFSLALLAGLGSQAFIEPWIKKVRVVRLKLVWAFVAFCVAVISLLFALYLLGAQPKSGPGFDSLSISCLLLFLTAVLALSRGYGGIAPKALRAAVIAILVLDYGAFLGPRIRAKVNFDRITNYEPTRFYRPDAIIQFLKSQSGVFRTQFDHNYPPNLGEVQKLDTIGGYGATRIRWFQDLVFEPRGYDLLNVKYVVSSKERDWQKVFQSGTEKVFLNPNYLPRAWLATHVMPVENRHQALDAVKRLQDLKNTAVVEGRLEGQVLQLAGKDQGDSATEAPASDVQFEPRGPNQFVVHADVARSSVLVVSEVWYPGWEAKVNGKSREIWRTDGALMGVYLDPGTTDIQFRFRPVHLTTALALPLLAFAFLIWSAVQIRFPFHGRKTSFSNQG